MNPHPAPPRAAPLSAGLVRRAAAPAMGGGGRLTALAAALALAASPAPAAEPLVRALPQPGVRIEQSAQTGVQLQAGGGPAAAALLQPAAPAPPAAATAAAKSPPPRRPPAKQPRPARRPQAQPLPPASAPMQPRLKLALALNWPPAAETAASAPPAATPATPASATAPSAPASGAATAEPAWWSALLHALAEDEAGHRQPDLPATIAAHAAQLRERADADLAQRLGWALYRAGDYLAALRWFDLALQHDPTLVAAREGRFYALQKSGELQRAWQAAQGMDALRAQRADVAVELALQARQRQDWAQAQTWLQRAIADGRDGADVQTLLAWSELQGGDAAAAAQRFSRLYAADPTPALAQGLEQSLRASGDTAALQRWEAVPGPLADRLRRQRAQRLLDLGLARDAAAVDPAASAALAGVEAPSVALGAAARVKDGSAGTSALRLKLTPVLDARWSRGDDLFSARIERWSAHADGAPAQPIGSGLPGPYDPLAGPAPSLAATLRWRRAGSSGPAASLGLTADGAVGRTWIGDLGWRDVSADAAWNVQLRRVPVDDSVLSLLGLRDPASGRPWGRVLREGALAQGYVTLRGPWTAGYAATLERLRGQNVAANTHWQLSLGVYRGLDWPGLRYFSVGPTLDVEHYQRNLSGFTWGQGGYFSPQRFISAALLAVFQTEQARRWVLGGQAQIGWQRVRQDASAAFALPPPAAGATLPALAASSDSGLGTDWQLRGAYLLGPHWALEGAARLRTGPAYHDRSLYLGVRYFFSARSALFGDDLPPVQP